MYFTLLGYRPSLWLLIDRPLIIIAAVRVAHDGGELTQLDPVLLESSASLGAAASTTFRRVTLPLIAPGIVAGAFLAFVASLDNVPVSLFLSDARTDMLPIRMWGMIESTLDVRGRGRSRVCSLSTVILHARHGASRWPDTAYARVRRKRCASSLRTPDSRSLRRLRPRDRRSAGFGRAYFSDALASGRAGARRACR